ncbi:thioredoxin [[Mycoplasma] testudinis]|uniref:thioredoxin n=1 Tax=[Mycoplasma] testudinis TaxID=33924 RepID=UPI0004897E08|nr:thioredoxin [[Mycoplasma] testudinis]
MKKFESSIEFNEFIKNNDRVLVDFYADWCGPCKMMAPFFEQAAEEIKEVGFAKLNVDEVREIAEEYEIFAIPTTIAFVGGKVAAKKTGFMPKEEIVRIANALKPV